MAVVDFEGSFLLAALRGLHPYSVPPGPSSVGSRPDTELEEPNHGY